jgi:chromosome segregation ATPase
MSSPSSSYATPGSVAAGLTPPSARRPGAGPASPTDAASLLELNKLRSDLRAKTAHANDLALEVRTLQKLIAAKDGAIEAAERQRGEAAEAALQLRGELDAQRRAAAKWELAKKRLQAEAEAANAEADRLSAQMVASSGANSSVVNSSAEDTVRLHNQLAEARKEVKRLRDEARGVANVLEGRDKALEAALGDAAAARAALAERGDGRNEIADLRRQLGEAQRQLSGEARLVQLVDAEVEATRQELDAKYQELEGVQGRLEGALAEAAAAQAGAAAAEGRAAEAEAARDEAVAVVARVKREAVERESPAPPCPAMLWARTPSRVECRRPRGPAAARS